MPSVDDTISLLQYFKDNWIAIILMFIIFGVLVGFFMRYVNKRDEKDSKEREDFKKSIGDQLSKFDSGFMFFVANRNMFQFVIDNFETYKKIVEFIQSGGYVLTDEFEATLEDCSERLKKNFGNGSSREKAVETILWSQNHLIEVISNTTLPDDAKPKFLVLTDFIIGKLMALLDQLEKIEERVQKPLLIDGNLKLLKMIVDYFKIVAPTYKGKPDTEWEPALKEQLENKYSKYYSSEKTSKSKEDFGVTV